MNSAGVPAAASAIRPIMSAPVPVEPGPIPQMKTISEDMEMDVV